MRLGDVKIGDKFYFLKEDNTSNRMYLRIDIDLKRMFPNITRDGTSYDNLVPCLDLTSYKVMCLNGDYEVEVEHDNVFI